MKISTAEAGQQQGQTEARSGTINVCNPPVNLMFPLLTKTFPANSDELASLLNDSIGRVFSAARSPVSVTAKAYPQLKKIHITLDGAELRQNPPKPPAPKGKGKPAFVVDELGINAAGLSLGPASADLRLTAHGVHLHQAKDAAGEIILLLQRAADGQIEISAAKDQIERGIAALAKHEAGKHGVAIEDVKLSVQPRGTRSVDAEVQLKARKLFFSTVIRIAAKLDLDDELNASLTGLHCAGEGAIGSLACGFLKPHLEKLDGQTFPLMALPLGEIRLRDVRLTAADKLTVTAEFGA
ncbi:MAG: hypothetical protein H0V56_10465 [Chthoniobacterales bacterium]|nr:hypothetical protein [Chthoniobacterales bacterium]